jgi:hypothetical protein
MTLFLRGDMKKIHNAIDGHLGEKKSPWILDYVLRETEHIHGYKNLMCKHRLDAVRDYIKKCAICQKQNLGREKLYTEPYVGSTYAPMQHIQVDHIGPLPEDAFGYKHILVVIDTCTRWTELYPCTDVGAVDTARHLANYFVPY